jgi:uncharacterized protein involved in cysteine biosynthesis
MDGMRAALRGPLRAISDRRTAMLCVVPMLVYAALFTCLMIFALGPIAHHLPIIWHVDTDPWKTISEAIQYIAAFAVVAMLTMLVGIIVTDPVYDLISERTEERRLGRSVALPFTIGRVALGIVREAGASLLRLALWSTLGIPLLFLSASVVAMPLSVLWAGWFLAYEYFSRSFIRHGAGIGARMGAMKQNAAYAAGFGVGATMLMTLPVMGPVLVVAGTDAYLDLAANNHMPHRLTPTDQKKLQHELQTKQGSR